MLMYIETKLLSNIPIRQQGNNDWDVHLLRLVGNGQFRARSLLSALEIFHPPGGWWLVVGGWWLVVAGWWLLVAGWWMAVGG